MICSFEGQTPVIDPSAYIAPSALVLGNVTIGADCYVGHGAIVRGDYGIIVIGQGTAVEENVVVHANPGATVRIGNKVTIGHGAVVHGNVKDYALVGMNAVVGIGATLGEWTVLGELALLPQNKKTEDGKVYMGVPAKAMREVSEDDRKNMGANKENYVRLAARYNKGAMEEIR